MVGQGSIRLDRIPYIAPLLSPTVVLLAFTLYALLWGNVYDIAFIILSGLPIWTLCAAPIHKWLPGARYHGSRPPESFTHALPSF
jgi:hypothetical protein